MQPTEIILNVYFLGEEQDMQAQSLQKLAPIGLGLYHSGVEINGVEYAYGGDVNNSGTGVFQNAPLTVANATYFQSYVIGTVEDINRVYEVLDEIKIQFKANEYSLIY